MVDCLQFLYLFKKNFVRFFLLWFWKCLSKLIGQLLSMYSNYCVFCSSIKSIENYSCSFLTGFFFFDSILVAHHWMNVKYLQHKTTKAKQKKIKLESWKHFVCVLCYGIQNSFHFKEIAIISFLNVNKTLQIVFGSIKPTSL